MRISLLGRFTLCASAAIALLAGCVAPATTAKGEGPLPLMRGNTLQSRSSGSTYKVTKGLLFVSLPDSEYPYVGVKVYDVRKRNPEPIVDITDGVSEPQSVCIDGTRTLYVLNAVNSISEYALGSMSPSRVITQGVNEPAFCAIDSHGNLWITNVGTVNVTEYLHGTIVPYKVITQGLTFPVGIAIDRAGSMYVANRDGASNTNVQVYRPGHVSPSRTITNGIQWPVGVGVDAVGTLYVTNLIPGNVEEYRSGNNKPYRTITDKMNGPSAVTFAPSGWMYVTNTGAQGGGSGPPHVILEFPPGSQTPAKKMITKGLYLPQGTAFYPPQLP